MKAFENKNIFVSLTLNKNDLPLIHLVVVATRLKKIIVDFGYKSHNPMELLEFFDLQLQCLFYPSMLGKCSADMETWWIRT